MLEQQCDLTPLAGSRICAVWLCEECRMVHLSIGAVTLRLKIAHFLKVVDTLREAAQRIHGMQQEHRGEVSIPPVKVHH